MKVDASNLDMYVLNDIVVSASHIVKYGDSWIPVSKHPMSEKIDYYNKPYVYCLNTTEKIIVINDTIFTDWDEIYSESLLEKKAFIHKKYVLEKYTNADEIENENIHRYLDGGFYENTLIVLKNRKMQRIKDIQINDILENGERVYALVVIDGTNIKDQVIVNLGSNRYLVGGPNIHFIDENLGQTSILELNKNFYKIRNKKANKLYHLVTDKGTFKLGDLIINDYNSCIDFVKV